MGTLRKASRLLIEAELAFVNVVVATETGTIPAIGRSAGDGDHSQVRNLANYFAVGCFADVGGGIEDDG